jgi:uncharacterized membrane protein YbhN (UPF0104 family)
VEQDRVEPAPSPRQRPLLGFLRHALTVALLGALGVVLWRERALLTTALDMGGAEFLLISACSLLAWLGTAAGQTVLLRTLGLKLSFGELLALYLGSGLLNYIPLRVGTLYRAHYLKTRAGLSYLRFGVFSITNTLMLASLVGLVGFAGLLLRPAVPLPVLALLGGAFLGLGAVSAAALFLPLPRLRGTSRLAAAWNTLGESRDLLSRHRAVVAVACLPYLIAVLASAGRFIGAYGSIGQEVDLPGILVVGAANTVGALAGVTPGGLGIQELLAGTASTQIGVALGSGVVAAMLVRAVILPWQIALGLPALAWLKRRPSLSPHAAGAEADQAAGERSGTDG